MGAPVFLIGELSQALSLLTAMITPALLISACGTFILSTSSRLGRVIDRVRELSVKIEQLMHGSPDQEMLSERKAMYLEQMDRLSRRAALIQRALTMFYGAAGIFVFIILAIGVVAITKVRYAWIPVALGLVGACFLFYGALILIFEARLAVGSLKKEMQFLGRLVRFHAEHDVQPAPLPPETSSATLESRQDTPDGKSSSSSH